VHGALIRDGAVLSTSVNPTDGHRFEGETEGFAKDGAHPKIKSRRRAAGRS
jgi:hypothetical protein